MAGRHLFRIHSPLRWLRVSSLTFGMFLLAACAQGPTPATPGGPAPTGAPAATQTLASPAPAAEPVRIGLLVDKTGALAAYGYAHEKVANAVVKKINAEGGISGRPVELFSEDTESDASKATVKARKLIEQNRVDFLVGSNTSAVVLAVAPVAKELKTVYFPTAGGALLTEPGKGNRYIFELNTDVRQETLGVAKFATKDLGKKKWVTFVVDYAWGWDQEARFREALESLGGQVLGSTRVPLGTADWLRYIQGKVPADVEGVYFANFGTDFLSFIRDLYAVRQDLVKFGGNYVLSGQDIEKLGAPAEGMYVITGYPQYAEAMNSPYDREYRAAIGMDDFGREAGTGKHLVPSYQWSTWEAFYTIKEVVEKSGWKGKNDTPKFITTLEGMCFKQSTAHPEGDKCIRAEDHLSLKGAYIEQVKGGKLVVVKRIPPEDMTYPPKVNYPKDEPLQ
jgi:branched-chain amino acid transport system substrate-binding protein